MKLQIIFTKIILDKIFVFLYLKFTIKICAKLKNTQILKIWISKIGNFWFYAVFSNNLLFVK